MLEFQKKNEMRESDDFLEESDNESFTSAQEAEIANSIESNISDNLGTNHNLILSIILSLNTCYHVKLHNEETRRKYRQDIAAIFNNEIIDEERISQQINLCYEAFLEEIQLPNAIARNQVHKFLYSLI